ncbi:carbonic anhydrase [Nitrobacteraceae bacterium AZCC 1564]
MLSRRSFCSCTSLALFSSLVTTGARAEPAECAVMTADRQRAIAPDEAIERLKTGNGRFVSGKTINCNHMQQVKETSKSQAPFAAIVGCMDSRVPPELIFDQRIGDVFCARVAGNFVNTDIIGSLEYAAKVAGARAIVVLGHSDCGAIKGAVDNVKLGNLTATLANIRPAVAASKTTGDRTSKNATFVQAVAEANVAMAIAALTAKSSTLKSLVTAGQLRIAGAMHDLATGGVNFLG